MRLVTLPKFLLVAALTLTAALYWPGLSGSWIFDDHPNIVENPSVQPHTASVATLVDAALSSPSSDFKRPLASLSFAVNYLLTGLDPYWMKLTNLVIHLLNGVLVFMLARSLLMLAGPKDDQKRIGVASALIAAGWMLLPINLTAVLYVVQRMESMANLFVLIGLIGYIAARKRMQSEAANAITGTPWKGFLLCTLSITMPTAAGAMAKETAVMLPLYALLIECVFFRFRTIPSEQARADDAVRRDRRILLLFVVVLILPMIMGVAWLIPWLRNPTTWATRNFTLSTRLLSEARIVVDYIIWTVLPTPNALSFYHDDFEVSTGLVSPWTTMGSMLCIIGLLLLTFRIRRKRPLVALGIALFFACHLLTATILPLELVYEHRNYFASFGIMLAVIPLLSPTAPRTAAHKHSFRLARYVLLVGAVLLWGSETAMSAQIWGNPLELAAALPERAPDSPRAQYELGRTYIIYSHYQPDSPFTHAAYAPLEKAAAIPGSSILPEQAMIFLNARMHEPIKDAWWDSIVAKLKANKPTIQDESSLGALTDCEVVKQCNLSKERFQEAYFAALSHPNPSPRLLAMYTSFAWNVMEDRDLGLRMATATVDASPNEPAYRMTLIRMLDQLGKYDQEKQQMAALKHLNYGGRLDSSLTELNTLPGLK